MSPHSPTRSLCTTFPPPSISGTPCSSLSPPSYQGSVCLPFPPASDIVYCSIPSFPVSLPKCQRLCVPPCLDSSHARNSVFSPLSHCVPPFPLPPIPIFSPCQEFCVCTPFPLPLISPCPTNLISFLSVLVIQDVNILNYIRRMGRAEMGCCYTGRG